MASYGTIVQRPPSAPAAAAQPSESMPENNESKNAPKTPNGFKIVWPFNIPSTEETAIARISKNFKSFALYYAEFVFLVLLITLIPRRKVSLVYLVIMKEIASLYLLLLRALPNSILLHKFIDKRFVFFLLSIITGLELVLTRAALHLVATLITTVPIIFAHACFWKEDNDASVENQDHSTEGESLLPLTIPVSLY